MQKLQQSKIKGKWLFGLWALLFVVFVSLSLYWTTPDKIIELNNLNDEWCDKYGYYLETDVSSDCLRRCWEEYGCEHNATGRRNTCTCTGGPLLYRPYVFEQHQIYGFFNSSFNTVGIDEDGNKIEVKQ